MRELSQKTLEVMKADADTSEKTTGRRDVFGGEQRSQEEAPQDSHQMWKELFLEALFFKALLESDKEKLTQMLQAAERVMVLRAQELLNPSNHHEERGEMDTALAALLSIKAPKIDWPAVSAGDGLS